MIVIMDENDDARLQQGSAMSPHWQAVAMAEYVIVLMGDEYEVRKDRFRDSCGHYPMDELPDLIRQRLIDKLRLRDGVGTYEENE